MGNRWIDLTELFQLQRALDKAIIAKHKENYARYDMLYNKVYALKNEVNEAWSATNAFQMWSTNFEQPEDSLVEEMVDILHVWLSVAMDFKLKSLLRTIYITETKINGLNQAFFHMDKNANHLIGKVEYKDSIGAKRPLIMMMDVFYKIIECAGFTWEDVVRVYKEKNQEHLHRLASGYE